MIQVMKKEERVAKAARHLGDALYQREVIHSIDCTLIA